MSHKKTSILLILSVFIVFLLCIPAVAQTLDSDGDGVPDDIEDMGPNLFGIHRLMADVATFPSSDGRYMTLYTGALVGLPGLELRNVTSTDAPAGTSFSAQAANSAPYGFISFDLIGAEIYEEENIAVSLTVTLLLHDYYVDDVSDIDLVRYGSTECPIDLSNPSFYRPGTYVDRFWGVGTYLNIYLTDGDPNDLDCLPTGTIPFIGAAALADLLDSDGENGDEGDGVLIFEDNCPDIYNPEQIDTDDDGMGDECDICPADADNDIDGDGFCGDVDNCPAASNPDQEDFDGDGIGDACEVDEETTVYSYLGNRFWRFFRDHDVWEIYAKAGESVIVTLEANPKNRGHGKKINLILFSKTRGARLLRLDRSALDPENKIEVQIPKDGKYGIVVGESFWWGRGKRYKGEYCLTIRASQEILDSLTATPSVGSWWQ
jgi:hypothetical protein